MEDCSRYDDGNGQMLACEARNEIIKIEKNQSFAQGALFGLLLAFVLVGCALLYRWADKKEKELMDKR